MVCRSFFVMSRPHSAKWHVSLAITSCDIVIAHHVRVMVVVMMVMIARLVMLNVVKHLYQVNIPPLVPTNSESDSQHQYKTPSPIILL